MNLPQAKPYPAEALIGVQTPASKAQREPTIREHLLNRIEASKAQIERCERFLETAGEKFLDLPMSELYSL